MKTTPDLRRRQAFTLTDLCVTLAILLMVVAMLPAIVRHASEESLKSRCSSNLKNIAAAFVMYSNTNQGNYPRTYFDPLNPTPTQFTGANASDPFKAGGPLPNDVTAAAFLLLRTSGMTPDIFVCPISGGEPYAPDRNHPATSQSNFPSPQNLTYSFNNPYPSAKAIASGWKWDSTLGSDYAIVGDLNPGTGALVTVPLSASTKVMSTVNSPNHSGYGQNVLYGDYHVSWQPSPYYGEPRPIPGGLENDNIYTSQTAPPTVGGTPQDAHDSVLLPMATDGFHRQENIENFVHWLGKNGASLLVLALVAAVVVVVILIARARTNR